MTRPIFALFAVCALDACRQQPVTTDSTEESRSVGAEQTSAASDAASADAASDAAPSAPPQDPVQAAAARFSFALGARWPGVLGFNDVIALARPGTGRNELGTLTWVREGESALVRERAYPLGGRSLSAIVAADVAVEAGDELLVFGEDLETFHSTVAVFSLPAPRDQPLSDGARAAAFDGARTVDEVRARLPLDRARTPQERAALSDTAMLGQLVFASDAELVGALAARGFQVCTVSAPGGGRRVERCRALSSRALTARVIESELRARLRNMFSEMTTLGYACDATPEHRCGAQLTGGYELFVSIAGAGADRRIAKITSIDHMIGE